MRRREFITLLGGVPFIWPPAARVQQTAMPVIGYLGLGSPESDTVPVTGLRRGLNEGGYNEDQDVTIEYRWAQNQYDRLSALAADLVQHRVAVIFTPGVFSTLAAKAATQVVPIVFIVGGLDTVEHLVGDADDVVA